MKEELICQMVKARSVAMLAKDKEEQAIRDAYEGGVTITQIAAVLGVKNKQRIYRIVSGK